MTAQVTARQAASQAAPAVAVNFFVAATFGALAVSLGMAPIAAVAMSAAMFAGSAQFGAVTLAAGGAALPAIVAGAALLNARFLPMGIALASATRGGPLRRGLEGAAVNDISFALSARPGGQFDRMAFGVSAALGYAAWVSGTVLGAYAGPLVGDTQALGLDVAQPMFFLVLLAGDYRARDEGRAAARPVMWVAAGLAAGLSLIAPPGVAVLAAGSAALLPLRSRGRRS